MPCACRGIGKADEEQHGGGREKKMIFFRCIEAWERIYLLKPERITAKAVSSPDETDAITEYRKRPLIKENTMTNLKTTTARAALIALIAAAAPMSALATGLGSSPQAAVDEDPQEYVEPDLPAIDDPADSMIDTLRANDEYDDADVVEDVDGSMIQVGPRDNG
jgi:hypothetical protein